MKIDGSVALVSGATAGSAGRLSGSWSAGARTIKSQLPRDHELIYAPLQQIFFAPTEGSC